MRIHATAEEIKGYREEYGCGMQEAKLAIEKQKALACLETSEVLGTGTELYAIFNFFVRKEHLCGCTVSNSYQEEAPTTYIIKSP